MEEKLLLFLTPQIKHRLLPRLSLKVRFIIEATLFSLFPNYHVNCLNRPAVDLVTLLTSLFRCLVTLSVLSNIIIIL